MVELKVLKLVSNISATVNNHLNHGWELAQPIQFLSVRGDCGWDDVQALVVLKKLD